ncbi:FAD-dependent oxidoreductase [Halomarina litorea]|uniref:FAD-dependent oxidoreductase n=1 Tax=Halomarina litorea TaxID=2961595 RepID=UPI0020C4EF5E|nr:FAD-dependent oxidoreductase [Halomarina sp. BCD28]
MPTDATADRDDPTGIEKRDVVVVGGGAAGLAAALFCARYGLDTLVFDRGPSAIRRAYLVENYLGLPAVTPEEFLAIGREQVTDAGASVVEDCVEEVVRDGSEGLRVETADGRAVSAGSIVAASAYDDEYLPEGVDPTGADEEGRIDRGLYAAGWLTGGPHQVLACAGHGTRVGKAVVADRRRADGWWDAVADYWDWSVPEGRYDTDEWHEEVDAWLADTRPENVSDEHFEEVREAVKRERLDFQTTDGERDDRVAAGRATLRDHLRWPDGR